MTITATSNAVDSNYRVFLDPSTTPIAVKVIAVAGGLIGLISSYVYYSLGKGFGDTVCDWTHCNARTRMMLEVLFGATAVLPMGALAAVSDYTVVKIMTLVPYRYCFQKKQDEIPMAKIAQMLAVISVMCAIFAPAPRFYLTLEYTPDIPRALQSILAFSAYFSPFCIGCVQTQELFSKIYLWFHQNPLDSCLSDAMASIKDLSEGDISRIVAPLNLLETEAVEAQPLLDLARYVAQLQREPQPRDCVNEIIGIIGFLVGSAANYAFYGPGMEAGEALSEHWGIEEKNRKYLTYFVLAMFLIPSIALRGNKAQAIFQQFYGSIKNIRGSCGDKICSSKTACRIASYVIGVFAATPMTYLAIQESDRQPAGWKTLIVPSFISPFSVSACAIQDVFILISNTIKARSNDGERESLKADLRKALIIRYLGTLKKSIAFTTEQERKNMGLVLPLEQANV